MTALPRQTAMATFPAFSSAHATSSLAIASALFALMSLLPASSPIRKRRRITGSFSPVGAARLRLRQTRRPANGSFPAFRSHRLLAVAAGIC